MTFDQLLAFLPPDTHPRAPSPSATLERLKQSRDNFVGFLLKALVLSRVVTARHVTALFRSQRESRLGMIDLLLRDPAVPRELLRDFAGFYFGVPSVELAGYAPAGPGVLDLTTCTKYRLFPMGLVGNTVVVATDNPANTFVFDDVTATTGLAVAAVYVHADGLTRSLDRLQGKADATSASDAAGKPVVPSSGPSEGTNEQIAEWHALRDLQLDEGADDLIRSLRRKLEEEVRRDPSSVVPLEQLVRLLSEAGLPFAAVHFVRMMAARKARVGHVEAEAELKGLERALLRRPWAAREWDRARLAWDVSEEQLKSFLLRQGFLGLDDVHRCMEAPAKFAFEGVMGKAVRLGLFPEDRALAALAAATKLTVWNDPLPPPKASLASWVPGGVAHERGILPLCVTSERPVVAISNPFNGQLIQDQMKKSLGTVPSLVLTSEIRLRTAIEELFGAVPDGYESPSGFSPVDVKLAVKNLSALLSALTHVGLDLRSEFHATRDDYSEEETFAVQFEGDRVGELHARYIDNHFWAFLGVTGTTAEPVAWRAVVGDSVTFRLEVDRLPVELMAAIRDYHEDPAHAFTLRRALQEYGRRAEVARLGLDSE